MAYSAPAASGVAAGLHGRKRGLAMGGDERWGGRGGEREGFCLSRSLEDERCALEALSLLSECAISMGQMV